MEEEDVVKEAYDRFQRGMEEEEENRNRAKEAIKFRDLDQWPEHVKQQRMNDPDGERPCMTLDKINQYINQVKNDQRQNKPAIKCRPIDDKGDVKVAEVVQGIIRHIEDVSRADIAYSTGTEHAVDGGFGYWRVITEYVDDDSFDQEPRIKRVRNRFSVLLDPDHQEPDGSDAKWAFIFDKVLRTEFESQYPDADPVSFTDYGEIMGDWCSDEHIIVAEYYRLVYEESTLYLSKDGRITDKDPGEAEKTRTVKTPKWEWRKLTSAEELDFRVIDCKYLPIVQVLGNEIDLDGKRRTSGMVRGAMDSMRMYNYSASAFVEMVALAPKAPWTAAAGQIENHETEWNEANRRNFSVLTYNPVLEGNVLVPMPQRNPMPGVPVGWQQLMANMEHDIQSSMGQYASNLGQQTSATSGKQELALQRKGDTGTFHYVDNVALGIRQTGRILIDMISRIYDTERVTRILGENGDEAWAMISPGQGSSVREITGKNGKKIVSYDLGVGKYDVTVTVGPAYATKRAEGAEMMANMITTRPELLNLIGDLAFRAMDTPYSDEIADRLKKMLPPELRGQVEDSDLPPDVMEAVAQAKAELDQEKQMMAAAAQEIQKLQDTAQMESNQAEKAKSLASAEIAKLNIEQSELQSAKEVFKAKVAEEDAKRRLAVIEYKDQMKEAGEQEEQERSEMEYEALKEIVQVIVGSNQELAKAVQAMQAEMARPKIKRSKVTAPSGKVYEHESIEQGIEETQES